MKFQNIADEQISAGESADFIISQLIAFNMTAEESVHIIDAINEVSNQYSVSSADLSQGLSIVASSSAAMGNSMEETLGLKAVNRSSKMSLIARKSLELYILNCYSNISNISNNYIDWTTRSQVSFI